MNKKMKVNAILTSDWHLRDTVPTCWIGDFWKQQWASVQFVHSLQLKYGCPVLHAGDLFHHWKPSPYLLSTTLEYLPENFYTVYGQHDLPKHNLNLAHKSGIHTLLMANRLKLSGVHWEQKPDLSKILKINGRKIILWHIYNYKTKEHYPGAEAPKARSLLYKYKKYDLMVTGDNHIPFVQKYKDRILVNPGPLTRQDADQIDYKPRVYLWNAKHNKVEPVYIPIQKGVISREHIEKEKERDKRISAFIEVLNTEGLNSVDFEKNLEEFLKHNNKIRKSVKQIIYELKDDTN